MKFSLGDYQSSVLTAVSEAQQDDILNRIWAHDYTVFSPNPSEVANRLGWLHMPKVMPRLLKPINQLVADAKASGFTHVLLGGMGGSSLAPEVFARTFGTLDEIDGLELHVLDSTDPGRVLEFENYLPLETTLYIIATKSGGTAETLSFFKHFYNKISEINPNAGNQFVAITDPGSKLVDIAEKYNFRAVFLNDPTIGGRYAALSHFGLVPAALIGIDVEKLLKRADNRAELGATIGVIMAELAKAGRDKLTFIISHEIESFGDWAEQLIAESTGKLGKGILPVVGEGVNSPDTYGDDRLFVYLRLKDTYDTSLDDSVNALESAGHPVITLELNDRYDLGDQFLLWEMATAVAGHKMGIQPFDQPNVESAKILARAMIKEYMESGELPEVDSAEPTPTHLNTFLQTAGSGDYISIHAYVHPTPATDKLLSDLATHIRTTTKCATTIGYGPRFLHSTGQLHKGDGGNGLFIQFVSESPTDAPIPNEAGNPASDMSFDVLKTAQALGDAQALINEGRRVIRFNIGSDVDGALQKLLS